MYFLQLWDLYRKVRKVVQVTQVTQITHSCKIYLASYAIYENQVINGKMPQPINARYLVHASKINNSSYAIDLGYAK